MTRLSLAPATSPGLFVYAGLQREAAMTQRASKTRFWGSTSAPRRSRRCSSTPISAWWRKPRRRSASRAPIPCGASRTPRDWVEGVEAAVAAIRRHAPTEFAALSGIGLSGQMHGATLLDAHDKPLRPAILWNDGRSFAECCRAEAARPRSREADRQPRHAGLHRAQDAVGRRARARDRQGDAGGCCCPRTMCACASPAKPSRRCPTPLERCGSTSGGGAGTKACSRRPA